MGCEYSARGTQRYGIPLGWSYRQYVAHHVFWELNSVLAFSVRVVLLTAGVYYSLLLVPRSAMHEMVRKVDRQEFQEEGGPEAG